MNNSSKIRLKYMNRILRSFIKKKNNCLKNRGKKRMKKD